MKKIFKNNYKIEYESTTNHRVFLKLVLSRKATKIEKSLLNVKVSKNKYYIDIKEELNRTEIEIYNKIL